MKFVRLCFKIIPLVTILTGIFSGGARLGTFTVTAKVALTQYEIGQITGLLVEEMNETNGKLIPAKDFSAFVKDNYQNQYSILAREINGDKTHDQSLDIWGQPFQLLLLEDKEKIKVASSGPDLRMGSKDDIAAGFNYQFRPKRNLASVKAIKKAETATDLAPEPAQEPEIDDPYGNNSEREPAAVGLAHFSEFDEDGFDRDGFNKDGYDRDGYDINGIHSNEKPKKTEAL